MDVFLDKPWDSFVAHVRAADGCYELSANLCVSLKTTTECGDIEDIGGYNMSGPSRAYKTNGRSHMAKGKKL